MKYPDKVWHNANKLAYLVGQYPDHTINDTIALFSGEPNIDVNAAIWAAVEDELIAEPDPETKRTKLLEPPLVWAFGAGERDLEQTLMYCLGKNALKEIDMEQEYLSRWCAGYPPTDLLVAMRRLLETNLLAEYKLNDGDHEENNYTYFTLYENRDKLWGAKQFKDPSKVTKVG